VHTLHKGGVIHAKMGYLPQNVKVSSNRKEIPVQSTSNGANVLKVYSSIQASLLVLCWICACEKNQRREGDREREKVEREGEREKHKKTWKK